MLLLAILVRWANPFRYGVEVRKPLLLAIFLPGLFALVVLTVALRPWRRGTTAVRGLWGGPLALGGGYAIAHAVLLGWPAFPPVDPLQKLFYLGLATAGLGLVDATGRVPAWLRWTLAVLLVPASLAWLLEYHIETSWQPWESALWLGGATGAALALLAPLDSLAQRHEGDGMPLLLLAITMATALVAFYSRSRMEALLAAGLSACLWACWVISWCHRSFSLAGGSIPVAGGLLTGLWVSGLFYGRVGVASLLLLCLTPLAVWLQDTLPARLPGWKTILFRVLLLSVLVGLAVIIPLQDFPFDDDED
jgi:hypothetical protein